MDYADALTILNEQLNAGEISFESYCDQALALGYKQMKINLQEDWDKHGAQG